jgi:hypothetical protein
MSFRGEMGGKEKIAWTLLLLAFLLVEFRSLDNEHAANEESQKTARYDQEFNFSKVLQANQRDFNATMSKSGDILQTTQQVENLAQENLENVTGGKSFAVITPQVSSGLVPIPMTVRNFGEQTLTGVTVAIRGGQAWDFIKNPNNPYSMYQAESSAIEIGTLHSKETKVLPETITPTAGVSVGDVEEYQLDISAQNFTVTEYLYFKKGKHVPWDFKYTVTRQYINPHFQYESRLPNLC